MLLAMLAVFPLVVAQAPQPQTHRDPWHTAIASWYYDEGETACGVHYEDGIANLTMPCGARVRLCFEGCVTARVQDRGPYIEGRRFDLSPETKEAISCTDLCPVRYRTPVT
jgi:rare lipoprotein A (peptidoglycan hydrolase)